MLVYDNNNNNNNKTIIILMIETLGSLVGELRSDCVVYAIKDLILDLALTAVGVTVIVCCSDWSCIEAQLTS